MKKVIKRALMIIVVIFILLIGIGLYFVSPMISMQPVETGQIPNTNIYSLENDLSAAYFIKTDDGHIMIDAGSDMEKINNSLKDANININDVKWIFLTHSDSDHVAALTLFPNATIYIGKDELPLINGSMKRNFFGGNNLPSGIDVNEITLLSNNQELSFNGTNVKCISVSGHTPGSMVYLIDNQYLFTGDAFKIENGNIRVHPFTMDSELSEKTIEKLKKTINSSDIVLTSHYGFKVK